MKALTVRPGRPVRAYEGELHELAWTSQGARALLAAEGAARLAKRRALERAALDPQARWTIEAEYGRIEARHLRLHRYIGKRAERRRSSR